MITREKTVWATKALLDLVEKYLTNEPANESECLGEDETISITVPFGDGYEMDIKCCGVQFKEGECNKAWTEAVLFQNGSQVSCTDPDDTFTGEWTLEDEGLYRFIVHVLREK